LNVETASIRQIDGLVGQALCDSFFAIESHKTEIGHRFLTAGRALGLGHTLGVDAHVNHLKIGHNNKNVEMHNGTYRRTLHRYAFCQFPFRWIYYCHSSKSTGKETEKTYLCAKVKKHTRPK
jgi:hypothetical protein